MASLQFVGRKAVVDAVRNRQLETWALFQGKQFITAGSGPDSLDDFLKKLEPGGTMAMYLVKVYRNVDPEDVTDKTECNGSFNFKLTDPEARNGSTDPAVLDRLERIEGALLGDEDDEDDEDNSLMGILMGYLKEPEKLATIIGAFRGLNSAAPVSNSFPAPSPGAIGSTEQRPAVTAGTEPYTEQDAQRLALAIDKLEKADPLIIEHLEKLAALAVKNPALFKILLTQLDTM